MKTNFQMLKELLEVYVPKERGIVSATESNLIKSTLNLTEMGVLDLRNLRDFTVLYMKDFESIEDWDKLSAITFVIDNMIFDKGGEV